MKMHGKTITITQEAVETTVTRKGSEELRKIAGMELAELATNRMGHRFRIKEWNVQGRTETGSSAMGCVVDGVVAKEGSALEPAFISFANICRSWCRFRAMQVAQARLAAIGAIALTDDSTIERYLWMGWFHEGPKTFAIVKALLKSGIFSTDSNGMVETPETKMQHFETLAGTKVKMRGASFKLHPQMVKDVQAALGCTKAVARDAIRTAWESPRELAGVVKATTETTDTIKVLDFAE